MTKPILTAATPNQLKLEILREHFPQAVEVDAQGHIRINAASLQQAIDPSNPAGIQVEEDGYEMRWVGKREAYHSAFVPVQKIIAPLPDESKNWDTTGNILMRGDNLDALRLLRHSYFGAVKLIYIDPPYNTQSDAFIYRDDFSAKQSEVLAQLGYSADNADYIKNIYGARTHSGWLSFMYPRLLLAKDLLDKDGVIFISIDDNEQAQLKLLCDEVFGQENWVGNIIWKNVTDNNPTNIAIEHENIICYCKNKGELASAWKSQISAVKDRLIQVGKDFTAQFKDQKELQKAYSSWLKDNRAYLSPLDRYKYIDFGGIYTGSQSVHNPGREGYRYPVMHPDTKLRCKEPLMGYRFPPETMDELLKQDKILFGEDETKIIELKVYAHEYEEKLPSVLMLDGRVGSYELRDFFPEVTKIFDNPKPTQLISQILAFTTDKDSVVVDFFAGSGTTGEAVMRLNAEDGGNRKFILVQIPQPIDPKKQKEAHNFVTQTLNKPEATIFEITAERLRRSGAKIEAETAAKQAAAGGLLDEQVTVVDTGFRVFGLVDDPEALIISKPLQDATQADVLKLQAAIATPQPAQLPRVLYNLLLAEGLPLTTNLRTIKDQHLYLAESDTGNVALIVQPIALKELTDTLRQLQTEGTPAVYLTVYAPWIADDNFMLGIKTMAESLGYSDDKLRLRG